MNHGVGGFLTLALGRSWVGCIGGSIVGEVEGRGIKGCGSGDAVGVECGGGHDVGVGGDRGDDGRGDGGHVELLLLLEGTLVLETELLGMLLLLLLVVLALLKEGDISIWDHPLLGRLGRKDLWLLWRALLLLWR